MFRFFPWWKPNRTQPRSAKPRPYRRRPEVESLEDRVVPATFHVSLGGSDGNTGGPTDPFRMIQTALNAAAATSDGNDVIKVEAGTYNMAGVDLGLSVPGSANLDNLQLLGGFDLGMGFTTRTPRSTIYIPQTPGDRNIQDVNVVDPSVTIDGFYFVFDGNGVGGTGGTRQSGGVLSNTTGFVFNDNAIEVGLGRTPATTGARSLGVASTSTDQTGLTITNNTIMADAGATANFNDYGHGIFLNPDPVRTTDAVISGNLITGTTLANGIVIDTTGRVSITGNTILRTGPGSAFNLALIGLRARSVATPLSNVTISGNTLDSAGRTSSIGIHFADNGGTQDITGVLVEKNLIQNNTTGVVIGPGANQNNDISATINYNAFTGNTTALFRSTLAAGTTSIDASRNWWDHISGPTTAANPGGLGQAINDTTGISFRPWLVYSPDTNPALPGVQLPTTVNILAGNDVSAAENDFTLLQNAVGAVAAGQTLNLSGDFDWTGTFSAVEYNASTNTSATADIRGVELPAGVHNVTITSALSDAHILGIGDSTDGLFNSFLFADDGPSVGNMNFVLEKLNIDDFENAVMFGWNGTGTFTGTKIRDNLITIGGDDGDINDLQNIAIYFAAGTNQQITGNTVTFQGDGIRTAGSGARSFGFQNNTTGGALYDNLLIDNNTFQLASTSTGVEINHGIWENGHNDDNSADIDITNNRFLGRVGVDDFDRALFLTSQTDGLVIDGNTFTDVDNVLFSRNAAGGVEAGDEFTFTNNMLTRVGGADGVFLRNVTDDATPITVVVHWNINNTIDGFTGVRGLNELSTQTGRTLTAASDLNAVVAEGANNSVFVDAAWTGSGRFTDPDGIGTGVGPVAFAFNGFATIQGGIDAVDAGGTVNVAAGVYAENVSIPKAVNLRGAQAGNDADTRFAAFVNGADGPKANPAVETVLTTPSNNPTGGNPNANDLIRVLADDITIDGLVLDGNNPSLGTSSVVAEGVNLHARRAITNIGADNSFNPVNDLTVQNNIVQNVADRGVSLSNNGPVSTGNLITGNVIRNFGDPSVGGLGILLGTNAYADITDNTIDVGVNGIGLFLSNFFSDGTMTWSSNRITVGQDAFGIHANLFYAANAVLNINSNTVNAATGVTGASDFTWGINVWSVQNGSTINVTGNTVGSSGGQFARGVNVWNAPTTVPVTVSGGSIGNSVVGINLDAIDLFFGAGAATTVNVSNVSITGGTTGIRVRNDPLATPPFSGSNVPAGNLTLNLTSSSITGATTGVLVQDTTVDAFTAGVQVMDDASISGSTTGILVAGSGASAVVENNDESITGNVVGIEVDGGSATVTANTITANGTGILVSNGGVLTSVANNFITNQTTSLGTGIGIRINGTAGSIGAIFNNDFSGNEILAINTATATTINASGNWWGTSAGGINGVAAEVSAQVDYTPWLEVGTDTSTDPGFQGNFSSLTVDDDSPQSGSTGRIQEGVNLLNASGTLHVLDGTYAENVLVNKSATLLGANSGVNPNTGTRGSETIVVPAVTATSVQSSTSGTIFRLGTASGHIDVSIDGFTIDGHNAALTGGRTLNGVEIHTGAGIVNSIGSFDSNPGGYDVKMIVRNNIIQNLERYGVLADGVPSTAPLAGTDVSFNKIDNLPSGNNFGGGRGRATAFEENHYGSFTYNVVTRVNVGWQNDNYYLASPGAGTLIDHNEIHTYHRGIFHNLQYNSATAATISNNDIFVETDGDFAASTTNFGIELSSIQSTVGVTVSDNDVTGTVHGILLWNLPSTGNITVSGGTLTNNTFGILATNNDPQFGAVSASTSAVVSGVSIVNATTAGIKVEDHPDMAATGLVSLTVEDDTSVSGAPTGILVSGANASALIQNNDASITGNTIGIDIDAGSATVTANTITTNGTGIRVTNGGSLTSASMNFITGNTGDGVLVTATGGSVGAISNNDLSGNTGFAVNNASASVVNASGNWFGSNTPAGVAAEVSSNVDYTPWLDVSTDTSTDAGFQGNFSTLHVDDSSPQAGATGRIQEGIDLATGTPTVIVEAGTYAESVAVNKMNLILRGATGSAADVVIDPTSGDGITVSATGATIRDLRVTGGMTGIVASNVAALTLANLLLDAHSVAGGSLSNITSVDFTASSGDDTVTVDGNDFTSTGVQSIGYTGVGSLSFHGDAGSDTFNVTPANTTTMSIDGDAPTPTATPGDRLNVTTAGTADPFLSFTSNALGRMGSYTFDDRGTISFQEIETLDANVDLSISKDDGALTEVPGTTVSYTITVSNAGGLGVGGVTVADMFPGILSGISFMSVASGGASGNTANGASNINDTVTLPVGGSITYTVNATISASATGLLSNTATVTVPTGVTDATPASNTATDTDTLTPQADLSLVKMFASDTVSAGATGRTFTIVVQNSGPSDAHNLVLDDIVSTQLSVTGITANVGSVSRTGNDLDGSLAALAPGAMWTITVTYSVPAATAPGLVNNTASVTATEDSASGGDSVTVTSAIDLKVNMRKSTSGLNVGSTVRFKVILTNFSTVTATNVQVTAQLPTGLTFVSATPTLGTYNPATGVWTVPALAAGSKVYLKIVARADGTVLGQVATTAQLSGSDQADITPFNNAKTRKVRIADVFRR